MKGQAHSQRARNRNHFLAHEFINQHRATLAGNDRDLDCFATFFRQGHYGRPGAFVNVVLIHVIARKLNDLDVKCISLGRGILKYVVALVKRVEHSVYTSRVGIEHRTDFRQAKRSLCSGYYIQKFEALAQCLHNGTVIVRILFRLLTLGHKISLPFPPCMDFQCRQSSS